MPEPEALVEERLWRAEDVADRLAIGRSKVYQLMKAGSLRSVLIGGSRRIPETGIRDFLAQLKP